jgi:ribonuclease-3
MPAPRPRPTAHGPGPAETPDSGPSGSARSPARPGRSGLDGTPAVAALNGLQERLGHRFGEPALLERAVTHPSWLHEHPEAGESNQRLEFLGDAVVQLFLTEELYALYPAEREGVLTRRRAALGQGRFLAGLAREIGLGAALRLSVGEETSGGRARDAALEDAFEAVIGAVHLDAGAAVARRVLAGIYGDLTARLAGREEEGNPKGRLQERVQPRYGNDALRYEVVRIEGADHARAYEVQVWLGDQPLGSGRGPSKKFAEEAAARAALAGWDRGPAASPA